MSSTSLNPVPLRRVFSSCDARLIFVLQRLGQKGAKKFSFSETRGWSHQSPSDGSKGLSSTSVSRSAKRRHSRTRRTFSDAEYPEVTANMVGPSTTPSKTKGKQPIVSSDESDIEPKGVYQHTRTRTGVIALVDYSTLAWGI